MSTSTLPRPTSDWALFLDFDGTLVELAERPELVRTDPGITGLLQRLTDCLDGAVAIVSGRSIDGLDRLLGDTALPMAGVHGLERRDAAGRLFRPVDHTHTFRATRTALERFVAQHPGTLYEDKGNALTLHYRQADGLRKKAEAFLRAECHRLGDEFQVQHGKAVLELKPTGYHKGTVIETFLGEPPFAGRTPVFIGDDVTDEDGFRLVNERGGHAIRVGPLGASAARWSIDSVEEVIQWLASLPEDLQQATPKTP